MTTPATAQPAAEKARLLPCPFCGGPAALTMYSESLEPDDSDPFPLHVHCAEDNDCLVRPDIVGISKDDAITRWNTRAQSAAFDAAVEALKRIARIDLDTAQATRTEAGSLFSAVSAARAALTQVDRLKKGEA